MRFCLVVSAIAWAALGGCGCTQAQSEQATAVANDVKAFCAAYGIAAPTVNAVIAADGSIVGLSAKGQRAAAIGSSLVSINCAAFASLPAAPSPAAVKAAAHVSPELLARIERHYAKMGH